jgi:hypothetical protein
VNYVEERGNYRKKRNAFSKTSEYLSNGFLQPDGEVREGINGEYSLAMAYRLKEEGITPENIGQVIEKLYQIAGSEAQDDPNKKLSSTALDAIKQLSKSSEISKSNAMNELFGAAGSWVNDWKNLAAFIVHLERIEAQTALLSELPKIKR